MMVENVIYGDQHLSCHGDEGDLVSAASGDSMVDMAEPTLDHALRRSVRLR